MICAGLAYVPDVFMRGVLPVPWNFEIVYVADSSCHLEKRLPELNDLLGPYRWNVGLICPGLVQISFATFQEQVIGLFAMGSFAVIMRVAAEVPYDGYCIVKFEAGECFLL
jgi:hypothetical protein